MAERRIVQVNGEHLSENVSPSTLAENRRLSPDPFVRSFQQSFGEPPHRYWTGRRVDRAKTLLANPRASITRVALDVGFSTTSAFSATFHRVVGQTPTDYRRGLE